MKPIKFEGSNVEFAKDQDEYETLPAFMNDSPQREVVTCWKLSEEDLKRVNETGQIWLKVLTFGNPLQPLAMSADVMINVK